MNGAREYAKLFTTGQHGKLFLVSGEHARGKTFHIWVLPSADPVSVMPWCVKGAVEVYGIVGGHPGWTESYGWLHSGKWQQDFARLVEERKAQVQAYEEGRERARAAAADEKRERISSLLAAY